MLRLPLGLTCLFVVVAAGCPAGTVTGQLDGKAVPAFGEAAFGLIAEEGALAFGFALPGDSCRDGKDVIDAAFSTPDDAAATNEANREVINDKVPEESWYISMILGADDNDDIENDTIELDDPGKLGLVFDVCFQDNDAKIIDGELDNGADCFSASDGDVVLEIDKKDPKTLRLKGEGIEMIDGDGDDAGDVNFDVTFSRCADIEEALNDAR